MSVFNQSRQTIIRLIFAATFLIIVVRLFTLQVVSGKYKTQALDNAVYRKVVYPDRGIIFDRNKKPILNNTIIYDLTVTPYEVKDIDTTLLCSLLSIDTVELKSRIISAIIKNGRYRPSVFEGLLPIDLQAKLEENMWRFPGFTLVERPIRTYPYRAGAHLLGDIGEVDTAIIRRSNYFYQMGDYVGRSGMEQYYESVLMGKRGVQNLIKDNRNRIQGPWENGKYDTAAEAGRNLYTYLDIDLQLLAEKLMANKVGSVVAIDPKTGGILAMVSGPVIDPNDLTGTARQKNYAKLALDVAAPLMNRATRGLYEPGSTFKPLGGLIALDVGVINAHYGVSCSGAYYGCSKVIRCEHHNPGHAANLRLALANSCNSYFSQIYRMTVDNSTDHSTKKGYTRWMEYLNAFGWGEKLGIDLPNELPGNIPDTTLYNKVYRGQWNSCTNVTLGIGQDKMQVTPVQLANAMCIIANKGYFYTPHFVERIDNETKKDTILNRFRVKYSPLTHIPDEAYEAIHAGMQDVVESGTARIAKIPGINICAKTGTAEKYTVLDGHRIKLPNNSMFVCFAPRENPKIAIAVAVENAGFGSTWAAPIASFLVEKYLTDSIRSEKMKDLERIASTNLMPAYLKRRQFIADSTRAYYYFNLRKDSSYIRKYLRGYRPHEEKPKEKSIVFIQPKEKKDAIAGRKPAKERKDNRNTHLFIRGQQLVGNDKKTLKAQISG
ncbi:MAG: penicillin-binding protein 2 [Sphingobacteriales bacterium]|mgnify:CR=1 FL=1|nr:penicillin-binding protein 2 [Sphingobacteriales bacterium]OJY87254.1 MAG: penicillin-binding protein 2 [Sphingobacteriales bacterium 44-15]